MFSERSITSVSFNAEAYPELEPDSFGLILERSQQLENAMKRKGYNFSFSDLSPEQQLRLGNRIMRELAKPLNGDVDAAVTCLLQDGPLPEPMKKALEREIASSVPLPTRLGNLLKKPAHE